MLPYQFTRTHHSSLGDQIHLVGRVQLVEKEQIAAPAASATAMVRSTFLAQLQATSGWETELPRCMRTKLRAAISESSREFQLHTLKRWEFQLRIGRRDGIVIGEVALLAEDIAAINEEKNAGSVVVVVIVAIETGTVVDLVRIW